MPILSELWSKIANYFQPRSASDVMPSMVCLPPPEHWKCTSCINVDSLRQWMDQEVRIRAYYKWEEAGRPDGRDKEFWFAAEEEFASDLRVFPI